MRNLAPQLLGVLLLSMPVLAQIQPSHFDRIFNEPRISGKKEMWARLTKSEQVEVRRLNFAWAVGHLDLDLPQIRYLTRFSQALPNIERELLEEYQTEALDLFTNEQGALLFGSIGPYASECNVFIKASLQPSTCRCSVGSKFNVSCSGDCFTTTLCTTTPEGCGFAWLFPCAGWCSYN